MLPRKKLVRFDWAMKNILRDKANFDILEGFLSELLKEQIKIDKLLESESNQKYVFEKFNRVDLLAHTMDNQKIIIEVQTASEWDFYHRILFGTSKVITEYIKSGDPYSKVPKVISVSILHFNLGEGSDYIYKGETEFIGLHAKDTLKLSEETIKLYINEVDRCFDNIPDIFPTYYLIQLPKFSGEIKDSFDQWVYFLSNEEIETNFNAQGINKAKEKLDVLKLSDDERVSYDKYWQNVSLEASLAQSHLVDMEIAREEGLAEGRAEGMQKGRAEGRAEGSLNARLEIARELLKANIDIKTISLSTQLTELEIKKLFEEMK